MALIIKNSDLIDCWISAPSNNKISVIYKFIELKIGDSYFDKNKLMKSIHFFNVNMKKYWRESSYCKSFFFFKLSKWLSWTDFYLDNVSFTILYI